jgi:hydroxymethylglutaryl-CoA lyase
MHHDTVQLVECPRDAMQGWKHIIPTERKIQYLNALLKVGFDTLDFGSFVSAAAIPQMADTAEVVKSLDLTATKTRLLAIIANRRGAEEASRFEQISFLGFPFSISETFQQRNTNSSIRQSLTRVQEIQKICNNSGKQLVVYISMGFGNPYGDPYSEETVYTWVNKLREFGISIFSIADTVGLATAEQVSGVMRYVIEAFPHLEIGVHLHSSPEYLLEKTGAAFDAGCRRFDGALKGIGGCPMANDDLVGNMNTEVMIDFFKKRNALPGLNQEALAQSISMAEALFQ